MINKNQVRSFIIILIGMLCHAQACAASAQEPLTILITNTSRSTDIFDDLQYLAKTIGGRPTGSAAMDKAAAWGLNKFKEAGLNHAYLETYTAPRIWLANIERGEIVTRNTQNQPQSQSLRIAALPFSPSTPQNGIKAKVYAINASDAKEVTSHAKQIKGRWLLVPTPPLHSVNEMTKEDLDTPPLFAAAKNAGAVGVLWISSHDGRLLYRHSTGFNGKLVALPGAMLERESGMRILKLLRTGKTITVKITLNNIIQENQRSENVVAEIKGYQNPDEVIVLGAHLDSWDLGEGALDNGCNVAMLLDVARQIKTLEKEGYRPRRTIRFMLFSGEEQGLYGSWQDVKKRRDTLDTIKTVIIYDLGSGRTTGFSLGGRADMKILMQKMLQPIANLGPFTQTMDAGMETDTFDYILNGIPTLFANQDPAPYLPSYHAESDTLDKVDRKELKRNTVIAAALVWNLANTNEKFPQRQNRSEVMKLLEETDLKEEMEIYQVWDDFVNKAR